MSQNVRHGPVVEVRRPEGPGVGGVGFRPVRRHSSGWPRLIFIVVCVMAMSVGVVMLHDVGPATYADRVGLITGVLAASSLAATVAYLLILAVLHVLPTGFSPIRHAVSDYGVGRYRSLFTVALYLDGVDRRSRARRSGHHDASAAAQSLRTVRTHLPGDDQPMVRTRRRAPHQPTEVTGQPSLDVPTNQGHRGRPQARRGKAISKRFGSIQALDRVG